MKTLTVACVFVKGPYPYTPEYVIRLRRMVQWHLPRQHRFVCLTDQPEAIPVHSGRGGGWIETIRIPNEVPDCPGAVGYWNKLQLFNPAHGLTGRVLFLDLDTLVVSDLAPIVDYPAPFALCDCEMAREKPQYEKDSKGRQIIRRFNASVMVWNDDMAVRAWSKRSYDIANEYQGDQDWYAAVMALEATAMPAEWFPRLSRLPGPPPFTPDAKVILAKKPKGRLACEKYPWFNALWGGQN